MPISDRPNGPPVPAPPRAGPDLEPGRGRGVDHPVPEILDTPPAPHSPRHGRDVRPAGSAASPMNTPAMRQYTRFKAEHPDCVLFFRMGDFYEMFNEDAKLAHEVLGITLTERTNGIPMAGVPYHAVETYLRRMIEQGYRVPSCTSA